MNRVLVDTSVWSLALRKRNLSASEQSVVSRLSELIRDLELVMIGPIRQEILSGIADMTRFEDLKARVSIFPDHEILTADYELAAQFNNACRAKGIQGSHTDFLICSVAFNNKMSIFTLDKDFENYRNVIGIKIEEIGST